MSFPVTNIDFGEVRAMQHDDKMEQSRNGSAAPMMTDKRLQSRIQGLGSAHRVSGSAIFADRETGEATSSVLSVSCVHSGETHCGRMQVIGTGCQSRVLVLYHGSELGAEIGALPAIERARELLESVVVSAAIANVVHAGENQK
ncbi:hypothetical protein [Lichenifustis flavocetrariae]|uniref:Uncharacterized protein n=1 Tax=Lichenifustis flavocetrariae TaxID=2949735 RepID=A0AA41Z115_9HYPH|nr:hypothetical protein [Lichenifustis flavocetrariae]MCW6511769.1 hypothetical protein [Lichenifustis flavocetrariae]